MEEYYYYNEDQSIGVMLHAGARGKNFVHLGMRYMDHPSIKTTEWSRNFGDDVILVHQLKSTNLLGDAIEYFLGDGHFHEGNEEKQP